MTFFTVRGVYPTQGEDAFEWGVPEDTLDELFEELHLTATELGAGTDLATGVRDVEFDVQAESEAALRDVLDSLPSDQRGLWTVEEAPF